VCRAVFEVPATPAVVGKKKHKGKVTAPTAVASSLPINYFASTVLAISSSPSSSSVGKRFADPNHVV